MAARSDGMDRIGSVAVRDGLVIFDDHKNPDRIFDADEVLDIEPVRG
jgi:hypothetical protein